MSQFVPVIFEPPCIIQPSGGIIWQDVTQCLCEEVNVQIWKILVLIKSKVPILKSFLRETVLLQFPVSFFKPPLTECRTSSGYRVTESQYRLLFAEEADEKMGMWGSLDCGGARGERGGWYSIDPGQGWRSWDRHIKTKKIKIVSPFPCVKLPVFVSWRLIGIGKYFHSLLISELA